MCRVRGARRRRPRRLPSVDRAHDHPGIAELAGGQAPEEARGLSIASTAQLSDLRSRTAMMDVGAQTACAAKSGSWVEVRGARPPWIAGAGERKSLTVELNNKIPYSRLRGIS